MCAVDLSSCVVKGTFYVGLHPPRPPSEDFAPRAVLLIEHLAYQRSNRGRV
jgi:hypothetical protein